MRLSASFSKEEICCVDTLLATIRRGGDVSVLMSSWAGRQVAKKFAVMKARCEGAPGSRRRRMTDDELSTLYGLNGILTWRELAALVGLTHAGLKQRVQLWKKRVQQVSALKEVA